MTRKTPRNEDGGYGASNLVGSNTSGLRSAIEAREAVEGARLRQSRRQQPDESGGSAGTVPEHRPESDDGSRGAAPLRRGTDASDRRGARDVDH